MEPDTQQTNITGQDVPTAATQNAAPQQTPPPGMPPQEPEEHKSALGPIIGVLVIIIVLVLGGLYLWGSTLVGTPQVDDEMDDKMIEEENAAVEAEIGALDSVNSSDEINALEEDLDNTMLDLDKELDDIDALLQ